MARLNKEADRAYKHAWYIQNRDRLLNEQKQDRAAHPDKYRERKKRYNNSPQGKKKKLENRRRWDRTEKGKLAYQRYRQSEKGKQTMRRFLLTEKGKAYRRKIKSSRRAASSIQLSLTSTEWNSILDAHNHMCAYCKQSGLKLEQDHRKPISKGGHHTAENIVPACRQCNAKKGDQYPYPVP